MPVTTSSKRSSSTVDASFMTKMNLFFGINIIKLWVKNLTPVGIPEQVAETISRKKQEY